MLKVLLVSAEVAPYSKSGGLGDVMGSLPQALREQKIDARVVLPLYKTVPQHLIKEAKTVAKFNVSLAWRNLETEVLRLGHVYFIKNDYYFHRDNYYGYHDDYERFAFFAKAAVEFLPKVRFKANVINFNDWHTALGPSYLSSMDSPYHSKMKSLLTIHNLHYQGIFGTEILPEIGLHNTHGHLEYDGNINYLKAGIVSAHAISTVSTTYAEEIQTPAYGYGMENLLKERSHILYGITNGIAPQRATPITKAALQQKLGLPQTNAPIISMITRLATQKGFDILAPMLEDLLNKDIQFIVLGTGEAQYENMFKYFAHKYPTKLSANITFNETLAEEIYAGSDMFLMPSAYEPCGLGQLFAMAYGTIPIVRNTGGLADTVEHFNPKTKKGNGFVFDHYLPSAVEWGIDEALKVYHSPQWPAVVKNALATDSSWDKAAVAYKGLYKKI